MHYFTKHVDFENANDKTTGICTPPSSSVHPGIEKSILGWCSSSEQQESPHPPSRFLEQEGAYLHLPHPFPIFSGTFVSTSSISVLFLGKEVFDPHIK